MPLMFLPYLYMQLALASFGWIDEPSSPVGHG